MSNQHIDPGAATNGSGHIFPGRRELRGNHITGMLPTLGAPAIGTERNGATVGGGGSDFERMVQSLHELFEQDRQIASQQDSTRCGICYLHFPISELRYREEGFYLCQDCSKTLGNHPLPMLRKQQKFS
jgi:hypothetical protein